MSLFTATNWSVAYGNNKVVHNIDFHVNQGEILLLMGPNGAGKSTVLKSLFGLIPHSSGSMSFNGVRMSPRPDKMARAGVSFVPQGNTIFSNMTIEENLLMGAFLATDKLKVQERLEEVIDVFPVLKRKRYQSAFAMSGGERQILALARALMTSPRLMMLDEPSIGLAPMIVQEVFEKIRMVNERFGTAVVIVEHNLKSLLKIAHRGYILVQGKIAIEGSAQELTRSDVLEKAFFGELA